MNRYVVERWLLITEDGGTLTDRFDPERLPDGVQRISGPFRSAPPAEPSSQPPLERAAIASGMFNSLLALIPSVEKVLLEARTRSALAPLSSLFRDPDDNIVHYLYYDMDIGSYQVPQYALGGGIWQGGQEHWEEVGADGYVALACTAPGPYAWDPKFKLLNDDVHLSYLNFAPSVQCADTTTVVVPSEGYHAFLDFRLTIPAIETSLGYDRGVVEILINPQTTCGNPNGSCFKSSDGKIHLTNNAALNSPWTGAHEFGHAIHHSDLGGVWSASNCSPHSVNLPSSYSCALQEGFADWVGNIGGAAVGHLPFGSWEGFHVSVADSIGMVEGNVAAMFHDLLDANNEGDDSSTYPGFYIATVFKTCWTMEWEGLEMPRHLVHQIVWCFENRTDWVLQDAAFPHSEWFWIDESESATEPGTWNADDVRATWEQNVAG
jgi:hypothetical protein